LKQLAIAVHNYHDTHQALPPATGGPHGPTTAGPERWSGFVSILPFFEMGSLYERFLSTEVGGSSYNWYVPSTVPNTYLGANNPITTHVMTMYCPSDGAYATKPNDYPSGKNYRFCLGDNPSGWSSGFHLRGNRGPFYIRSYLNLSSITDGTSNTLMLSEHCMVDALSSSKKKKLAGAHFSSGGGFTAGTATNPSYLSDRTTCLNSVSGNDYTVTTLGQDWGWGFVTGTYRYTTFVTTLPPNSPSCYYEKDSWNQMVSTTSYHSGGVNTALIDGSCRFISETINSGTAICFPDVADSPIGDVSGASPFGIWGAYGSRNGDESLSF
jgi:hypothetical protein